MANKKSSKSSSSSSNSSRSSSSSSSRRSVWSLNKISFWTIVAITLLYAISLVLSVCGLSFKVVSALQGIAAAITIIIVAVLAWRYIKSKPMIWKVLYIICLLIVIACIIVPLVK